MSKAANGEYWIDNAEMSRTYNFIELGEGTEHIAYYGRVQYHKQPCSWDTRRAHLPNVAGKQTRPSRPRGDTYTSVGGVRASVSQVFRIPSLLNTFPPDETRRRSVSWVFAVLDKSSCSSAAQRPAPGRWESPYAQLATSAWTGDQVPHAPATSV